MTTSRMTRFQLPDHWTPAQALAVIEMIDLIRDQLWSHYADDIQRAIREDRLHLDPRQLSFPIDQDNDPF